ncbi:MAG TPA: GNAT family N-acetyltransferase [Ktedonobacteraceae bacterium]|nr:GNAT family N-acetyltransferase [Ktedonobacteraceae bacterium]
MSIIISPFTEAELEATDVVVRAAYSVAQSREDSLRSYLTFQSAGSFVAKEHDAVVGFGGVLDYGPFAYIGLMSVSPTVQKRGIGQLLMERLLAWVEARSCPTTLLDANPAGEPLYRRNGFLEDDRTVEWQQNEHVLLPRHLPLGVSLLTEAELPALIQFDVPHFGAERAQVLSAFCARYPHRVLVIHTSDERISGYAVAQSHVIGPIVAQTQEDAERLLVHALTLPFESKPSIFVSAQHNEASHLLTRYGFVQQRTLSHMWIGKHIVRNRHTTLYGQASLGFG